MYEYVKINAKPGYVDRYLDEYAEKGYRLHTAIPVELYGENWIMLIFERQVQN